MTRDEPRAPAWMIDLPTCPSTNSWALERLDALAHGACVWTPRQTRGRGQNGAVWFSPPGVLTASFVLDLPERVSAAQLSLCAGLAVAHAVEDLAPGARVRLKWPNDCYLDERKLAGVLCERCAPDKPRARAARPAQDRRAAVVVGIGLNLDPQWDQAPDALPLAADKRCAPASVAEIASPPPSMRAMLAALRRYLLEASGLLAVGGWEQLLPHLRSRDWLAGKRLALSAGTRHLEGVGEGIDGDGCLLLRRVDGKLERLASASVLAAD